MTFPKEISDHHKENLTQKCHYLVGQFKSKDLGLWEKYKARLATLKPEESWDFFHEMLVEYQKLADKPDLPKEGAPAKAAKPAKKEAKPVVEKKAVKKEAKKEEKKAAQAHAKKAPAKKASAKKAAKAPAKKAPAKKTAAKKVVAKKAPAKKAPAKKAADRKSVV